MALAELKELRAPVQTELPQESTDALPVILTDLKEKFGERFVPDSMREYVKGADDKAKDESKAYKQMRMTRELASNEVLIVTFTGKIDAFVYAHPIIDDEGNVTNKGAWDAGGLQFVGGWTLEKYE